MKVKAGAAADVDGEHLQRTCMRLPPFPPSPHRLAPHPLTPRVSTQGAAGLPQEQQEREVTRQAHSRQVDSPGFERKQVAGRRRLDVGTSIAERGGWLVKHRTDLAPHPPFSATDPSLPTPSVVCFLQQHGQQANGE